MDAREERVKKRHVHAIKIDREKQKEKGTC